jgi:EAL domain-containing protein (putative c-di-GMP-specific phosphodiesterase class I)
MTVDKALPAPATHPELLLEYLRVLEPRAAERRAVRVAAGRLRPLGHLPEHRRSASQSLMALVEAGMGELFLLCNDELLFFYRPDHGEIVNSELNRLANLFTDRAYPDSGRGIDQCLTHFDCANDFPEIIRLAKMHLRLGCHENDRTTQPQRREPEASPGREAPLTLETLTRLEAALSGADFSSLINRHSVCRLEGRTLKPTFTELSVSIAGLAATVAPGLNLTSNVWLFDVFTEILDRRMLSMLAHPEEISAMSSLSLNLNIGTLLSEEFLAFDAAMTGARRADLVIELKDKDVFHDLPAFLLVRELLQRRGYRFCLDGVSWRTLDLLDSVKLGFDFVKVNADQAVDESGEHLRERLVWMVKQAGMQRFILSRVESPEILAMGRDAGVRLFQGRQVDRLLAEQRGRP